MIKFFLKIFQHLLWLKDFYCNRTKNYKIIDTVLELSYYYCADEITDEYKSLQNVSSEEEVFVNDSLKSCNTTTKLFVEVKLVISSNLNYYHIYYNNSFIQNE
jgi:hypothetical protein